MIAWVASLIPWWAWAIAAIVAVAAVERAFGWKAAIGAAIPLIAALGLGWAKNAGAEQERAKNMARQLDAVKTRKESDDEIADLGHADVDSALKRWLRDNDDK